jgi:hypothetical protein
MYVFDVALTNSNQSPFCLQIETRDYYCMYLMLLSQTQTRSRFAYLKYMYFELR